MSSKYAANTNLSHVILDNGAGRIKYGPPPSSSFPLSSARQNRSDTSTDDMVVESSTSSTRSNSNSRDRGGHSYGNSIPNCVARMNKQMQVLVGHEADSVTNGSLLTYTRPFERGYMTDVHCQIEVWSCLFNKVLKVCTTRVIVPMCMNICMYVCVCMCANARVCVIL